MEFSRATKVTPEVAEAIEDAFERHVWTDDQAEFGETIRQALVDAVKALIEGAPACPDRTIAIGKLREAWADAASAIVDSGRH